MAKTQMINSQSFRDGKILLYQLANRPQQKWLCRLKVPNGAGYIYRGTGTSDPYEARRFADDLYESLLIKIKMGEAITGANVAKVIADFAAVFPSEAASERRARTVIDFLKTYAEPYFVKKKITELTDADIHKFFDWRRLNTRKKTPTNTTIVSEMGQMKVFTDWCLKRGYITKPISYRKPATSDNRRPHFTEKEWGKLTRFLREWVKDGQHKSGPIYRDRLMLTNYVLILANTGIRVGEARTLKWSDIDIYRDQEEKENVLLWVKGKTGSREVVARTLSVKDYIKRIWDLRCDELGRKPELSEYIFCHKDGKAIHSFKKGFNALIAEADLEYDSHGNRRVIYSLRHTYATFRLHEGVNQYTLARNMGTSVRMLEAFYGHTSNRAMASELTKTRAKTKRELPWDQ